jgi:hypothetical protein
MLECYAARCSLHFMSSSTRNSLTCRWRLSLIGILLTGAVVAGCGRGYIKRMEQFEAQVKQAVNPDELQQWATNCIASTKQSGDTELDPRKAPGYIKKIYNDDPEMVWVHKGSSVQDSYIEITYGSGFGHWGLFIGDPSFTLKGAKNLYVVQWKSGIYFFDGDG